MNNSWVIIRVSNFSKDETVMSGVYLVKDLAEDDSKWYFQNEPYWKYTFHVVEYESEEHKRALRGGK